MKILQRENTKPIMVGDVQVGGENQIILQSMTTTKTRNINATVEQIERLTAVGCKLVRVACPTVEDAEAIAAIKERVSCPIIADVHFDYRIALAAIAAGADKIRINPGNMDSGEKLQIIVEACKEKKIPIRVGVNAGSLEKSIMRKYGFPTADGMVESASYYVKKLEDLGFTDIIISLKANDMLMTIEAYEKAAQIFPYPLHIGVTESGADFGGTIKSAMGLGILVDQKIGSTMRFSVAQDPVEQIKVGRELLKNFQLNPDIEQ